MKHQHFTVLVAEDSEDDQFLIRKAFTQACPGCDVEIVHDGEVAIQYMMGEGKFGDRTKFRYPSFIITDLKMPRADGLAVLEFLKKNPDWSVIPTVVLSGSANEDDVRRSYMLGASSYHVKPATNKELQELIQNLVGYWRTCEVPAIEKSGRRIRTDSTGRLGERYPEGPDVPLTR